MPEKKPGKIDTAKLVMIGTAAVVVLTTAIYLIYRYEPTIALSEYLSSHIHPTLFLFLMLVLPIVGVPITIFLVLVGIKFGIAQGLILSALIMSFHMAVTYYLVHSFLRRWVEVLLKPFNVSIPKFDDDKRKWPAVIFMLIPGLPYAAKNNLLAMAEVGFVPYMVINWTAQFGLSIPFIVLGGAVMEMDLKILIIALALLLAGYLLQHFLRKKYGNL